MIECPSASVLKFPPGVEPQGCLASDVLGVRRHAGTMDRLVAANSSPEHVVQILTGVRDGQRSGMVFCTLGWLP